MGMYFLKLYQYVIVSTFLFFSRIFWIKNRRMYLSCCRWVHFDRTHNCDNWIKKFNGFAIRRIRTILVLSRCEFVLWWLASMRKMHRISDLFRGEGNFVYQAFATPMTLLRNRICQVLRTSSEVATRLWGVFKVGR